MYEEKSFTGEDLPSKTLCLTYDDGPGKDTYEIASFLHEQNIRATFFVVGKYAIDQVEVLEKVSSLGHLIGNHTYEHPDMPYYLSENGDVINQVLRTDAIIEKFIDSKIIFFRSPYGKWSKEVANELNLNLLSSLNHIGPINWDIGGIDCFYWKNGKSVEDTVQRYLHDIMEVDKGIVVMHDEIADMEYLKKENLTLELTKQLIPLLKSKGFHFVRLDEIDSIQRKASEVCKYTLQCASGKYVALAAGNDNSVIVGGPQDSTFNKFEFVDLKKGRVALLASNGFFLSVSENDSSIRATSIIVNELESFDLIPISVNDIMLRAYNGNYLTKEKKGAEKIVATAAFMRGGEIFTCSPVGVQTKVNTNLAAKYKSITRKIGYIESKIREKFRK